MDETGEPENISRAGFSPIDSMPDVVRKYIEFDLATGVPPKGWQVGPHANARNSFANKFRLFRELEHFPRIRRLSAKVGNTHGQRPGMAVSAAGEARWGIEGRLIPTKYSLKETFFGSG